MNNVEVERCKRTGIGVNQVLRMNGFVKGDDAIFAVTDGELLRDVRFTDADK